MIRSLLIVLGITSVLASCGSDAPPKNWGANDPLEQIAEPRQGGPELHGEMGVNTQMGF